jgi:hypothetical protein
MDNIITFLIGITIGLTMGTTFTYGILHRKQHRKIVRLEHLLEQFQRDLDAYHRAQTTPQTTPQTTLLPTAPDLQPIVKMPKKAVKIPKVCRGIQAFLLNKGIQIRTLPRPHAADETLDRIAVFMGTRYQDIGYLYGKIKSNMNLGKTFTLRLKGYPEEQVSGMCQFGTHLHEIAFLEEYYYQRSPKFLLYGKPSKSSQALNFLSGHWLERFIKEQVIDMIENTNSDLKYAYLVNPQVILPDGADFEFDVIFQIEDEIFWFEAKTGEYQRHVEKYSKVSSLLDLDEEHSYMILLDMPETQTKTLSSLFNMTVVNLEQFPAQFERSMKKYAVQPTLSDVQSM